MYTTAVAAFPNARFLLSAAAPEQFPADHGAEVAFAGRSNAGKSSAINAIVGRQGLARTSKTPGRTRLINFFELAPRQRIVDLPGYGYASAPAAERRTWPRLIEALRARDALKGLFVIIDARRGVGEGDEALLEWALPRQRVHVLLAKADKLSRNEGRQVLAAAAKALDGRATVQLFSAHARAGLDEAQAVLRAWLADKEKTPMTSAEATGAD
ncbi:MAG TPA: ribosome biogenesis GTP-binding protein YihA/YsxC [Steroidobacteraceae bacterium]|nr:ribosome biogenesis GTP-binding protein YihA/YsxC [Steroidobacteraceae bacterium]